MLVTMSVYIRDRVHVRARVRVNDRVGVRVK